MERCSHSYFYFTFSLCPRILRPEKQGCECYCELALTLYRVLFTSVASMNIQPSRRHCLFCFTSMGSCCLSSQSLYARQRHTGEDPLCFQQLQYRPSFLSNANTLLFFRINLSLYFYQQVGDMK